MRSTMAVRLAVLALVPILASGQAAATTCTAADFGTAVDRAGATLRAYTNETQPKLKEKLKVFASKRGWTGADFEERALNEIRDDQTAAYDAEADDLLTNIDELGRPENDKSPDCGKLLELNAAATRLLDVMKQRSSYIFAKIDREAASTPSETTASPEPAPARPVAAEPAPKLPVAKPKDAKRQDDRPQIAKAPPPKSKPPAPPRRWDTETTENTAYIPEPVPDLPPPGPDEEGYTIEEIREATRGFFGTISTSLASVIEHAFRQSGRPSAYVLGTEGGVALIAGLRYGEGTLFMRRGGTQPIYWHGPSVGYDVGATGSRTMFLIYHTHDPQQLYRRFAGIDGSAYLIGGIGITFLKGGDVVMAPIRTGLGLRLGANVGFVRFTPQATWNPF